MTGVRRVRFEFIGPLYVRCAFGAGCATVCSWCLRLLSNLLVLLLLLPLLLLLLLLLLLFCIFPVPQCVQHRRELCYESCAAAVCPANSYKAG